MIQTLKVFKALDDKFKDEVNLKVKESSTYRQELLDPWKVKDNNNPDLISFWNEELFHLTTLGFTCFSNLDIVNLNTLSLAR